jgi:hypothetical protein
MPLHHNVIYNNKINISQFRIHTNCMIQSLTYIATYFLINSRQKQQQQYWNYKTGNNMRNFHKNRVSQRIKFDKL